MLVKETNELHIVRAQRRAKYLTGFLWHAGTFVIINAFFWLLDAIGPGGLDWSIWITAAWGFALAFHGLAYLIDGRDLEGTKTRAYIDDMRHGA